MDYCNFHELYLNTHGYEIKTSYFEKEKLLKLKIFEPFTK